MATLGLFLSLICFLRFLGFFSFSFLAVVIDMFRYGFLYVRSTCLGFGIMLLKSVVVSASTIQILWVYTYYLYIWFFSLGFLPYHFVSFYACLFLFYERHLWKIVKWLEAENEVTFLQIAFMLASGRQLRTPQSQINLIQSGIKIIWS